MDIPSFISVGDEECCAYLEISDSSGIGMLVLFKLITLQKQNGGLFIFDDFVGAVISALVAASVRAAFKTIGVDQMDDPSACLRR